MLIKAYVWMKVISSRICFPFFLLLDMNVFLLEKLEFRTKVSVSSIRTRSAISNSRILDIYDQGGKSFIDRSQNLNDNAGKAKIFWDGPKSRFCSTVTGRLNNGFVE